VTAASGTLALNRITAFKNAVLRIAHNTPVPAITTQSYTPKTLKAVREPSTNEEPETRVVVIGLCFEMEVAKRLEFDPTETLTSGLQDPAQQRFQSANMAALQELQQ
jgi:hypothetical protein